jgi:hypothetical protein
MQTFLEFLHLLFGHIPGDSVPLLDLAGKIFAGSFGALEIIVRELAPLLLDLARELLPLSCNAILIDRDIDRARISCATSARTNRPSARP